MAISRVPGAALLSDLDRQGIDLEFTTSGNSLVYMDFANFRMGINESAPTQTLQVNGNVLVANGHTFTSANITYDIGSTSNYWRGIYANQLWGTLQTNSQPNITSIGTLSDLTITGNLTVSGTAFANVTTSGNLNAGNNQIIYVGSPVAGTDAANKNYVDTAILSSAYGNVIELGAPVDGNITSPGAWAYWNYNTSVTDAIDDLNEMMENVRANTFVKSVTFTSNTTAGGAGTTVMLTIVPTGTANRYDITWGDGTYSNAQSTSSPTHTYTDNTNSPYDVVVRAYNNAAAGTGSEASLERIDYITVYTADPVMAFGLYRVSSSGSALSGSNLYVTEGDTFYLDNDTTNTTMASVEYKINFGDGTGNANVASDSASGGVLGTRYAYTYGYGASSGTGTNTVTLYLTSHTTANPNVIPKSTTTSLKVYDANIATPNGLSSKTISFSGSVGSNPYLAGSFTDNTGGAVAGAGSSISRTVATGTTAVSTATTTTYAYTANSGILSARVNGGYVGNINLAASNSPTVSGNTGIAVLSDYWLLDATGTSTVFASSIYSPGRYYGFTANVTRTGGSLVPGLHSYQLYHSTTGSTNKIEFVKDDVTAVPTVSIGNLSIKAAGTYRYISGIPYFNTGSPTLWLVNTTISSFIGQTYNNTSNVVFVGTGTKQEGTSSDVITATNYTYSTISNSSVALVNGSGYPIAGTGNVSAYTIGNLTVPVTSGSIRSIANLSIGATNVNGTSAGSQNNYTRIAVHTAAQSGISEIAITANASLGDGTYTDTGIRSTWFTSNTTQTPAYAPATNFYTTSVYSESSDPGVAGTKEATIRLGVLKYDVNNYSSGYLPAGPDRSADTGMQYMTFAFRRRVVASFSINIVAPSGVANVWIAAPGSTLDSTSGLNGWLHCGTAYAGSGKPGSNTGTGGNGSDGVANTTGDRIQSNVAVSGNYRMTLGTENLTNATNNICLVRIALVSGQTVTTLGIV